MGTIRPNRREYRGGRVGRQQLYLDPRGRSNFGIGLCARCSRKLYLEDLFSDPNFPGLMVCIEDLDVLDPTEAVANQ